MKRRKLLPRKTIFRGDVSPVSQISTNERRSRKVCSSSLFVNGERERGRERVVYSVRFLFLSRYLCNRRVKKSYEFEKKKIFVKSFVVISCCFYDIIRKNRAKETKFQQEKETFVKEEKYRNRIVELQLW